MSIPKDNGKNRQYGFVTYKYQSSVPYALAVFAGTKLFNRDLRLNNRCVNKNNNNNNNNNTDNNQARVPVASDFANIPPPVLPNIPQTHQFQLQNPTNPFSNAALRGNNGFGMNKGSAPNQMKNMLPTTSNAPMQLPPNTQLDFQTLLAYSAQMLASSNGLGSNGMGTSNNDTHKHQSKIMHRHENRSHNQNSNYSRDRRNDRRRSRSRSHERDRNEWIRNRGRDNNPDRRNHRGDNNRRRNDKRI